METNINTYKLNQGNKEYILTISTVGGLIRITCRNSKNDNVTKFSRDFSINELKRLDPIFNSITTANEALDYIDNALKVQKVGVTEEADIIQINFYISKQGGVHNLELGKSSGENYIQTTTTTTSTFNMNPSIPFGKNFSFGQTPSFDENKNNIDQYLSQINTNTYQETQTQNQYFEGGDTTNTNTNTNAEYIQTSDNTTDYLQNLNLNLNTDTTTQFGGVYDTTAQYTTGLDDLTQQYTTDVDITNQYTNGVDITNQYTNGVDITNQYTNTNDVDIANLFTNSTDITNQYTNGTDITNQYSNGADNLINEYTNGVDVTGTTTQYDQYATTNTTNTINTTPTPDYTSQFPTNFQNTSIPPYTAGGYTTQYTETTSHYTNVVDPLTATVEKDDSNNYLNGYNATVQTVDSDIYSKPAKNIDSDDEEINHHSEKIYEHYITKTDINTQNVPDERINKLVGDTNSLKSEHQLIQNKLNALSGEMNAYKTKLELMERERADSEVNALRAENKAIKEQLSELSSLRNDAAEVRVLRTQLAQLDPLRRKAAEMEVLKGQLNELHNLRAKAAELNAVKAQLGELGPLRAQVGQMNILKQQLAELNALKAKLAELSGVRSQLGELNNLRNQVSQINILKQQINELGNLKENAINAENLKKKINELEDIKYRYEQEIRNLKEGRTQTISSLKMRTYGMDSKQLLFEDKPQQVCVKGDIIHNTDELELLTRKMNKTNQKLTLNLLYKASADTDKAEAFHAKCDDAKSTLVLVETDKGKRFGGFTTCSWSGDCIDKKDEDAFVFSLDKMEIYENIPGEDAIGCYPKFGPIFLGCQIRIYDNAFTKGGTTFEKGLNFNTEEDYELTGGERVFNVREIEVYEVIPE